MKTTLLLALTLLLAGWGRPSLTKSTAVDKPGDYTLSLEVAGKTRYYKLHVPRSYDGKATPLLVALHGGGGDMEIQSTDEYYHQISKSESAGYIVAFPNGFSKLRSGKFATWNAGRCCGAGRDTQSQDVAFIGAMIDKIQTGLKIDPRRIYASGISNGGMMAYRLACDLPERFRAIAAVAGTDNTSECAPAARATPVLHIHARDDDHVLFAGGAGQTFRDKSSVTEFTSVPATISKWTARNGCPDGKTPRVVLEIKGARCERYEGCRDEAAVELCVTESGGHSWPGGKKPRALAGSVPSTAISATDVIWDFFVAMSK